MLTGKRVFAGERTSDVVAQIIEREPDLSALPPDTPPAIRRLIGRCLAKDPRQRLRDIGDARFELAAVQAGPGHNVTERSLQSTRSRTRTWVLLSVLGLAAALGAAMLISRGLVHPNSRPVT